MLPYPHRYSVTAAGAAAGAVRLAAPGLAVLDSAPPVEFDGPGDLWSPETLLCAAVADCFVLTFRAVARASKLPWSALDCRVEGVLDRVEGSARFARFITHATLQLGAGADAERARLLLDKAERGCLVANSLTGQRELVAVVLPAPTDAGSGPREDPGA